MQPLLQLLRPAPGAVASGRVVAGSLKQQQQQEEGLGLGPGRAQALPVRGGEVLNQTRQRWRTEKGQGRETLMALVLQQLQGQQGPHHPQPRGRAEC